MRSLLTLLVNTTLLLCLSVEGTESFTQVVAANIGRQSIEYATNLNQTAADQRFKQGREEYRRGDQAALTTLQEALAIYRKIGDRRGETKTLQSIGAVYEKLDQFAQALEFYQQALAVQLEIGDHQGEGSVLNSIGGIYHQKGALQQALNFYQRALAIRQQVGDRAGEGRTRSNIGAAYDNLGQYPQALTFYQQALAIFRELDNRKGVGATLNNIGLVHSSLGQYELGLTFYQQALKTRQEIGDRQGKGTTLHNIGFAYDKLHQPTQALYFYQQSLQVRRAIKDQAGEATTLNNQGYVYNQIGQRTQALKSLRQALKIFQELGNRAREGNTLDSIGTVYKDLKQFSQASDFYQQALGIFKEIGDRPAEGITLSNIGFLLDAQKQPELAIIFLKQSVNVREAIRQELRVLSIEQQQSYTQTVADTYRHLADLLLRQDRVLEAQQVLDLLKVQELEDYLRQVRGTDQQLTVLRPEQQILEKHNELQKTAVQLGQELTQLRKVPDASRTPKQQQRIAQLVQLEKELNRQFNQFVESPEIVALVNQLNSTASGQSVDVTKFNRLRDDLRKLGNAVLLYPLILDDRLELVITTPDTAPLRRTVQVKREDLNQAIVEFRKALQNPIANVRVPAQKLYNWLIKPLEADLKQAQTIIYAPDSQLRYIPLSALYDGNQWLVERYRINNITAESLTDLSTRPLSQPRILVGAFTDAKVSYPVKVGKRSLDFQGLPFAGQEVANLVALIPGTTKFLNRAFNLAAIEPRLNEYNIIHFATHAVFLPGAPEDSFILFGDGKPATLKSVEDWSLQNVDLVVLSACETGLGGKLSNGEEVLGLGYQFQSRGARATIASLWQVDDGGTQALMSAFYQALKGNITKAEALQKAQLTLIKNNDKTLKHPNYWAPFILIGNGL